MSEQLLANIVSALIDAGLDGPDGVGHSDAKAALRAIDAAGYAVVPKEPTEDMTWAGADGRKAAARMGGVHGQTMEETYKHTFKYELAIYRAMLAASPDVTGDEG